jgi:hypothetical protein
MARVLMPSRAAASQVQRNPARAASDVLIEPMLDAGQPAVVQRADRVAEADTALFTKRMRPMHLPLNSVARSNA